MWSFNRESILRSGKLQVAQRSCRVVKSLPGQPGLDHSIRAGGWGTPRGSFQPQPFCEKNLICTQQHSTFPQYKVIKIEKADFQITIRSNWFRQKKQMIKQQPVGDECLKPLFLYTFPLEITIMAIIQVLLTICWKMYHLQPQNTKKFPSWNFQMSRQSSGFLFFKKHIPDDILSFV